MFWVEELVAPWSSVWCTDPLLSVPYVIHDVETPPRRLDGSLVECCKRSAPSSETLLFYKLIDDVSLLASSGHQSFTV